MPWEGNWKSLKVKICFNQSPRGRMSQKPSTELCDHSMALRGSSLDKGAGFPRRKEDLYRFMPRDCKSSLGCVKEIDLSD